MSTAARERLAIVKEIHSLTVNMGNKKEDVDFLVDAIDRRQKLMDEYDKANASLPALPAEEMEQAKKLVQEIIRLDKGLESIFQSHRDQAKTDLKNSNSQQKLLGYINQAMSSSGTYMDYKK